MSAGHPDTALWLWAGQMLTSPVAVQLFTAPAGDGRIILFAGVADGQSFRLIAPGRFPEFLQQHGQCQIICANAAELHWTIHHDAVRLREVAAIRAELWRMSAEHRLLDVQLFEQLVQLALSGDESSIQPLAELTPKWCGHVWEPVAPIEAEAIAFRDFERFPPELVSRASRVARSLWDLYHTLHQVAETATQKSVGSAAGSPYGPLGLGLAVQARIALEKPQRSLVVDESRAAEAIAELELEFDELTPNLRRLSELKDCFRWDQGQLVRDSDLPRIRDAARLRNLLIECHGNLLGPDGAAFPTVDTGQGVASILPEDWGVLGKCDPNLRAWSQLNLRAHQLHFIRRYHGQPIDLAYSVVPRIRPHPRASILDGLISSGLLSRPEGGRQIVLHFEGLELRALASWCEHRFGRSVLAADFRNGSDPVGRLADRLTINGRPALRGEDQRRAAPQLLLTAIGQKIGLENTRRLLRFELDQDVDRPTTMLWEQAAFELFPELRSYRDDVIERLAANLGVSPANVEQLRNEFADFIAVGGQVLGTNVPGPALENLIPLIADVQLRVQIMTGSNRPANYEAVFGRAYRSPTGRVRAKSVFAEGNAEYLDLADDALKAAIYSLAAAGIEIMAVANRKVLVTFSADCAPESIVTLAAGAASRVLAIPVTIEAIEGCG